MTDRELMQQAYAVPLHEQLASVPESARLVIDDQDGMGTRFTPVGRMCHEAAAALRERLAQPEQEPVAWVTGWHDGHCVIRAVDPAVILPIGTAFYTAPQPRREWVGLTDEEKSELDAEYGDDTLAHLDAIEAKLKEKNT